MHVARQSILGNRLRGRRRPSAMGEPVAEILRGEARMHEAGDDDDLMNALLHVARCPEQTDALYRLLGDFCHQFRNQLNGLKFGLYLAKRATPTTDPEVWHQLDRAYHELEQLIEQFQTICRPMPLALVQLDLASLLADRQATWEDWLRRRAIRLVLVAPAGPTIGRFDSTRLVLGLDAFVSWRSAAAANGSVAQLGWRREGDRLALDWEEPRESASDPPCCAPRGPLSLAIPLLARIVSVHGGTIAFSNHDHLRLSLSWPAEPVLA
jgi:hypothetical protein